MNDTHIKHLIYQLHNIDIFFKVEIFLAVSKKLTYLLFFKLIP